MLSMDEETLQKCEDLLDNRVPPEDRGHRRCPSRSPDPSSVLEDCKNHGEGTGSGGDSSLPEKTENLQKYEELFAHRFSSEDHEYQQYKSRPPDPPPTVEDWWSRGGGNYRERDNRNRDRRGWGGDRDWRGGHHRPQHWHDGNRDRHSGHGSGYQYGPQSSNQGYSADRQTPRDYN
ncbi:RNA guanine-N7 methyltransferase activating subunit-like [Brachionichthys hirsutus]|uniref:RNA guanine-N7 methyltransferase activating subunit-like n=1 Tax=Brachionichthys hirsutus TaxID=412623 RepID=UPI003604A66C